MTNNALVQAGYPQYCAPRAQDVAQLASVGQDFCSSYISYVAPTSTSVVLSTPPATTPVVVSVQYSTVVSNSIVTVTAANKKRRDRSAAIPTPDLVAHWPSQKISAACSLVATGTALTTVTSVVATPVVTATSILISTTSSISISTTTTTAARVRPESRVFPVRDSAGYVLANGFQNGKVAVIAVSTGADYLQLDSGSFLYNGGARLFLGVNSITGHDQLFYLSSVPDANKLFCTLEYFDIASGSLTCSVGGAGGQQNIFQICGGNYYIGTSVTPGCQQVTLTAGSMD